MADLAQIVSEKFKGEPYDEDELISFISDQGYENIKVSETFVPVELINTSVNSMKKITMRKGESFYTLFIAFDAMDVCVSFKLRNGVVDSVNQTAPKETSATVEDINWGAAGMGFLIIGSVLGFMIYGFVGIIGAIFSDDGSDSDYEYIDEDYNYSDDKDADGDVDYDDVEKYLEDSLEEDKNDGDDW